MASTWKVSMRLTKTAVDNIQAPQDRGQAFYRDDSLKGFAEFTKLSITHHLFSFPRTKVASWNVHNAWW